MTPKQEAFVREYLIDLNASAAYRRAGYAAKGNAAEVGAHQLLRNPKVAAAVAHAKAQRAERTQVDADWVLRRLHEEAEADMADLYDANGNLKPVAEWPKVWRTGLVAGVETVMERVGTDADGKPEYSTVRKVKLADRTRIKELVGKHVDVGAFKERIEVNDVTDRAEQMRRRREERLGKS